VQARAVVGRSQPYRTHSAAGLAEQGRNAPSCFKSPLNTEDRAPRYEYKNAAQRAGPVPRIHKTQFHATKGHDGAERDT
jgi:hypothetical protein